jgi:hypothetical protein
MKTKWDFAGFTDMWSTSAGGHLMKVVNLTGFILYIKYINILNIYSFQEGMCQISKECSLCISIPI